MNQESINTLFIVGDKFSDFANGKEVVSFQHMFNSTPLELDENKKIVVGQGISSDELEKIKALLRKNSPKLLDNLVEYVSSKIPKQQVHKCFEHNVHIAEVEQVSDTVFQSQLVVDDDCMEMSDHQTGEHIQGTLLIEASRQMFMACSHVLMPETEEPVKFTLEDMKASFKNFIFPMGTLIELEFGSTNWNSKVGMGTASVKFIQFGEVCCEISWTGRVFKKRILTALESRSANRARVELSKIDQTKKH